jgi:hypothetical protein
MVSYKIMPHIIPLFFLIREPALTILFNIGKGYASAYALLFHYRKEAGMTVRKLTAVFMALAFWALPLTAAPSITKITPNTNTVGTYNLFELTAGLTAAYANPYDPDQIDLSATFTSPSGKLWTINGFYDGAQWKIRFAAGETGTWNYVVKVKDSTGTTLSAPGSFVCTTSTNHGWIKIAPNKRYLCYDDGTSFYGVGSCYCWGVTAAGLSSMQSYGFNTFVYWNGTYDNGYNLIESPASGIGKYDQTKCARIDTLLNWANSRGLKMILVVWSHDYLAQTMTGSWVNAWSKNVYGSIVSCANFYSDTTAWKYQVKQYRYDIARWGYCSAFLSWQLIDEISGTDGWVKQQASATAWMKKIAAYFIANDPFGHPTNGSQGNYWPAGDSVNSLTNTENYGSGTPAAWATIVKQLWNGFAKPAISGEASGNANRNVLWSTLANGIAITPLMWQFNQGWSTALSNNFPPLERFIADINFAGLTNPAQAKVTVTGATAYGITANQLTFGWITGAFSGKSMIVTGLANGRCNLEWWACSTGTRLSTTPVTITGGTLTATVPATTQTDIAYKIIATTPIDAARLPMLEHSLQAITYERGFLHFGEPMAAAGTVCIMNVQGRVVANIAVLPSAAFVHAGRLEPGMYLVKIISGNTVCRKLLVRN